MNEANKINGNLLHFEIFWILSVNKNQIIAENCRAIILSFFGKSLLIQLLTTINKTVLDFKRQCKNSGLRPGTSGHFSLVVKLNVDTCQVI